MFVSGYDTDKSALKDAIHDMERTVEKARNAQNDAGRFIKLIQKHTELETLDRFVLHELIDRITIWVAPNMGRKRKGKEKIITIYYKFVGALQLT